MLLFATDPKSSLSLIEVVDGYRIYDYDVLIATFCFLDYSSLEAKFETGKGMSNYLLFCVKNIEYSG